MANFEDVIQQLIDTNNKLLKGEIDIKTAQYIVSSTQVLINAARLQLDIFKTTKDMHPFIEAPATIGKLKSIARQAADLNNEPEDKITDKKPFPF